MLARFLASMLAGLAAAACVPALETVGACGSPVVGAGRLVVSVTDAQGAPRAGLEVTARNRARAHYREPQLEIRALKCSPEHLGAEVVSAKTDATGVARLLDVLAGRVLVSAGEVSRETELPARGEVSVSLQLAP